MQTHFLGGGRHFGSWEVADIGIIIFVRDPHGVRGRKVALLQSKRLYPNTGSVREETTSDYTIGFGRLDDPEDEAISIGAARVFNFTSTSRYKKVVRGSRQVRTIEAYQRSPGFRVYYQMYNPWQVPFSQRVPLRQYVSHEGIPELGIRVVPASVVHSTLKRGKSRELPLRNLRSQRAMPKYGWRLESFVADQLFACSEGNAIPHRDDPRLGQLFGGRTAPIAAAISITMEAPSTLG